VKVASKRDPVGCLALYVALNNGASSVVVRALIEAYPAAAQEVLSDTVVSTQGENVDQCMPLHLTLYLSHSEEVVSAVLKASAEVSYIYIPTFLNNYFRQ